MRNYYKTLDSPVTDQSFNIIEKGWTPLCAGSHSKKLSFVSCSHPKVYEIYGCLFEGMDEKMQPIFKIPISLSP